MSQYWTHSAQNAELLAHQTNRERVSARAATLVIFVLALLAWAPVVLPILAFARH